MTYDISKDPEARLKTSDAAKLLGISKITLERWRHHNFGPPYVQVGSRLILYKRSDLIEWLESFAAHTDK